MKLKAVKFISFCCTLMCLSCMVVPSAIAVDSSSADTIVPFYTLIKSSRCSLTIDSNGSARVSEVLTTPSNSASSSISLKLTKKSGTSWKTVNSWSSSQTGVKHILSKTTTVSKGTYRAVATITVRVSHCIFQHSHLLMQFLNLCLYYTIFNVNCYLLYILIFLLGYVIL